MEPSCGHQSKPFTAFVPRALFVRNPAGLAHRNWRSTADDPSLAEATQKGTLAKRSQGSRSWQWWHRPGAGTTLAGEEARWSRKGNCGEARTRDPPWQGDLGRVTLTSTALAFKPDEARRTRQAGEARQTTLAKHRQSTADEGLCDPRGLFGRANRQCLEKLVPRRTRRGTAMAHRQHDEVQRTTCGVSTANGRLAGATARTWGTVVASARRSTADDPGGALPDKVPDEPGKPLPDEARRTTLAG